jgi:hypothetical protein
VSKQIDEAAHDPEANAFVPLGAVASTIAARLENDLRFVPAFPAISVFPARASGEKNFKINPSDRARW